VAAFRAGHGDFLEQTQPIVEQFIAEGAAHLVVSIGRGHGAGPVHLLHDDPEFLVAEPDVMLRFTRAVYRTQALARHPCARSHRRGDRARLPRDRSRDPGAHRGSLRPAGHLGARSLLRRPGHGYLQEILLNGGFIKRRHPYEDLVDTHYARQAMDALGP